MIGSRAFWLGAFGSAGFIAIFVVLFVDFGTLGTVLGSANYTYVAPSLVLYFLAVWFRTYRWKVLLRPLMGEPTKALYPVVVVGYMANNLIPVRIGEVLRSYYLSLRERVSGAAAFGTVAVERAADTLALLFFFAVAGMVGVVGVERAVGDFTGKVPGGAAVLILAAILPFVAVSAVAAFVMVVSPTSALQIVDRILWPVSSGLRERLVALAGRLMEGLTVVNSVRSLVRVFLLSLPVWAAEAAMYYLISLGFDLRPIFDSQLEYVAVILVFTAAANLAGVLPSTAGSWGPFDFFGAAALVTLGVQQETAAAYALTVHVALWVPVTALGVAMLVVDGTSLGRLMHGIRTTRDRQVTDSPETSS